jgi:crotonobetainyl-CoA:carnitine CoA-transferase CaiB-like acyl-CoA transferase
MWLLARPRRVGIAKNKGPRNLPTGTTWVKALSHHVPAARVRTMSEAIADPQLESRGVIYRHAAGKGIDGAFGVPLAAFQFAHGGPRIDAPPPALGQHNAEIF